MTKQIPQPNAIQRNLQRVASNAWMGRAMAEFLHYVDRPVFKLSGSQTTLTSIVTGLPIIMLTTTGAKSGATRIVPLVAVVDGKQIVLIASNFGQTYHPGWYFNLCKNPQCSVAMAGQARACIAREVTGAEYDRYWQHAVKLYAGYAAYKERTGGRRIPIMVLTPRNGEIPGAKGLRGL